MGQGLRDGWTGLMGVWVGSEGGVDSVNVYVGVDGGRGGQG